jgi:hypothetical protein
VLQEPSDLHMESCIGSSQGEAPKVFNLDCDIARRDIPISHRTVWAIVRVMWTGDASHRHLAMRSPEHLGSGFTIPRSPKSRQDKGLSES